MVYFIRRLHKLVFFFLLTYSEKKKCGCVVRKESGPDACEYRYYILLSVYGLVYLYRLYILCGIFCQVFFPMAIRYQDAGIYETDLFVQPFSVGSASTRTSMNAGGGGWISAEY